MTNSRKSVTTSRGSAIACLVEWAESGKPAQWVIDKGIHNTSLKNEDRQLAVRLVMGVIRRQQYLDIILSRFSKTPLRKMKPLTRATLRVGIYQLCFLDRIPDSAAVNETVKAFKKARQPGWLVRFVNGTLRSVARKKNSLPAPDSAGPGNTEVLEHPAWLTERWQRKFGRDRMLDICRMNSREPELCLQVNPTRVSREQLARQLTLAGIDVRVGRYSPESLVLTGFHGSVTALPGFTEGKFQVQDQAAYLCSKLFGPLREKGRYLDACAGLGGKTCALSFFLPPGAVLDAVEPDPRRSRLLVENLQRMGFDSRVRIFQQDLQSFASSGEVRYDGILVDAPCSGTGVIRKHPDIRWNRTENDLAVNRKTQGELLQIAGSLLAPGGTLVYATCSLEPEENEQVVDLFLAENTEYVLTDTRVYLPESAGALVNDAGMFSPVPSEEIEGFFAARMVRKH